MFKSKYVVYTPEKKIVSQRKLTTEYVVKRERVVELLYLDAKKLITDFSTTENNKEIYAVAIELDTDNVSIVMSISSMEKYKEALQSYPTLDDDGLYCGKYNGADCSVDIYEFINDTELSEIMNAFYCISVEHPISDVSKSIAFEIDFTTDKLEDIAVDVINKLWTDFEILDKTDDFIAYVAHHDISNEDGIKVMKRTNDSKKIDAIFFN